jgi:acetyl/propionyl-CoA carboxylase alpha subunit
VPAGVRVDSGVETGSVISPFYDALLAKVVAHGATREEACARLAGALARTKVHGVTTNRDLLVRVLRSAEFLAGEVDTGYLDRVDPAEIGAPLADDATRRLHAAAAALAAAAGRREGASPALPSGWRSVPGALQQASYDGVTVGYAFRRGQVVIEVDGEPLEVSVRELTPELVDLEAAGIRRRIEVHQVGDTAYVDSALGSSVLVELARFPEPGSGLAAGSLTAPMPGTVVRVLAEKGQSVAAGDVLVVLEAMKMEHSVRTATDGTVEEVLVEAGQQVEDGSVLVVVT